MIYCGSSGGNYTLAPETYSKTANNNHVVVLKCEQLCDILSLLKSRQKVSWSSFYFGMFKGMQRNISRSFPLLIQGWTGLWQADFLAWYPLARRKSLQSGFAICLQQRTRNIAVLDVYYYQAHKISLTNQGSYLCSGWILHNTRRTVPSVLW